MIRPNFLMALEFLYFLTQLFKLALLLFMKLKDYCITYCLL